MLLPSQSQVGFLPLLRGQNANFDISIPDVVTVVLEGNMPFLVPGKPREIFELALGDQGTQSRASQIIFEDLLAVEPILDVSVSDDYAHLVIFADRMESFVCGRDQTIKRACRCQRIF